MGSSASKKPVKIVQQQAPKLSPITERQLSNRSPPQSPQVPAVLSRQASIRSRVSTKLSITKLSNGIEHRSPFRTLNNHTSEENNDVLLPPINNLNNKSSSRPSTRGSSIIPLPAPVTRLRLGSNASLESSDQSHWKSASVLHGQAGRCSHCPHCQRTKNRKISPVSQPKWLTTNPGSGQVRIAMDEYDVEAVKKKIISENGHLPGSYDYRPYLTIEQIDDYDQQKENYYTQPLVAKTKPRVLPTCTPFPDYDLLQRREQRLNKPYALPLFAD